MILAAIIFLVFQFYLSRLNLLGSRRGHHAVVRRRRAGTFPDDPAPTSGIGAEEETLAGGEKE